jgi:hypothetical protein
MNERHATLAEDGPGKIEFYSLYVTSHGENFTDAISGEDSYWMWRASVRFNSFALPTNENQGDFWRSSKGKKTLTIFGGAQRSTIPIHTGGAIASHNERGDEARGAMSFRHSENSRPAAIVQAILRFLLAIWGCWS